MFGFGSWSTYVYVHLCINTVVQINSQDSVEDTGRLEPLNSFGIEAPERKVEQNSSVDSGAPIVCFCAMQEMSCMWCQNT